MIVLKYGLFYAQEKETWITIEATQFDEQTNEPNLWAVRRNSGVMSNKTGEFSYEPFPSSRTEEFFKEFRFSTVEDAKNTWEKFNKEKTNKK